MSLPSPAADCHITSEYFVGFSKNHEREDEDFLTLTISTPENESVNYLVSSPYGGYHTSGTVSPSSYTSIPLHSSLAVRSPTDRNKGIWIRATNPSKSIIVSGMNYEEGTADAFLALPSGPVTKEYTYITSSMLWTNRTDTLFPSLILIVGIQNNTTLTITPTEYITIPEDLRDPNNPHHFAHPGHPYTVTLNQLQTYQIESNLDLTGSKIVSNKPLSVFSGHECTDVPGGVEACDHLFEQIPPTSTWGRLFFLVPSDSDSRVSPEWYRMVSSKSSTTISITCYLLQNSLHSFSYLAYITNIGGIEEFQMERDNYCYVSADKPVLVIQYAYGGSANNDHGDPFMMMIIPTEQYVVNTTINFYAYEHFISDITIVILQDFATGSIEIELDNAAITSDWTELYCSEEELCGYTVRLQVSAGFHTVRHQNSSIPVAVYVYGFGRYQGYGYPASMELRSKLVIFIE